MKNHIFVHLLIVLLTIPMSLMGKDNFEQGSITLVDGQILEGLVRTSDPRHLGQEVFFKKSQGDSGQFYYPNDLKGFSMGRFIYRSAIVDLLDKEFEAIKTQANPNLKPKILQKEVFLEVLLQSDLSLYSYFDENIIEHFFIEREGKGITALWVIRSEKGLVNNRDISNDVSTTGIWELSQVEQKENFFLLQLGAEIKDCQSTLSELKKVKLERKSLLKFLNAYHECNAQSSPEYLTTRTQTFQTNQGINLSGNMVFTDFVSPNQIGFRDYEFLDKTEFTPYLRPTFGYFVERSLLPFRSKMNFYTGINIGVYQIGGTYKQGTEEAISQGNYSDLSFNYSSVDLRIPVALRYYINDAAKARIFVQAGLDLIGFFNVENQLQSQSYLSFELQKDESIFAISPTLTRMSNIGAHAALGVNVGRFYTMIRVAKNRSFTSRRTTLESSIEEVSLSLGIKLN
ncbi:MAG: hypothetical protein AB8H47_18110 [Bacteroidia bacterium]